MGAEALSISAIEVLRRLIAIPSVNPRLAPEGSRYGGEQSLTDFLIDFCHRSAWKWTQQMVHPSRSNVLALIPGGRGDTFLWDVHQDTVSGDGMSVEPFSATVRGGRVYGRGACDVKGAMAAMLTALLRASAAPPAARPNVLLACTVNEECGFTGARALAGIWQPAGDSETASNELTDSDRGGMTLQSIRDLRPAAAIIAEPTELNVVVAHRGVVRWQCTVEGRAAHSSRPDEGVNAIYAMADVVQLVERYHRTELQRREPDPFCGPPTAAVTTIHGGVGPNTIPDRVVIDVDRRLTPDERPEAAYREMVAYMAKHVRPSAAKLQHGVPWMESHGLHSGPNNALAGRIADVAKSLGVDSRIMGVPYGTNAASLAAAGIPAVVFGPGSIAQAHTADEWIAVEQLELAEEAYYQIACGAIEV